MHIEHIAIFVRDLEKMREFYEKYFRASANDLYHNPKTGLTTYFLSFPGGGGRLELMCLPEMNERESCYPAVGFTHLAFGVGSEEAVDSLTKRLADDGFSVVSGPRRTGDGYYESCVLDAEGNQIEIAG